MTESTLSFSGGNGLEVATGINTLSNVGIDTTNPTDPLTVRGAANISGVITASSFSGIGSFLISCIWCSHLMVMLMLVLVLQHMSSGIISATKYYGDGSALLSEKLD